MFSVRYELNFWLIETANYEGYWNGVQVENSSVSEVTGHRLDDLAIVIA
jgi:hypothetical protein